MLKITSNAFVSLYKTEDFFTFELETLARGENRQTFDDFSNSQFDASYPMSHGETLFYSINSAFSLLEVKLGDELAYMVKVEKK